LPTKFRLHGLRHHYASSLVSAGVDLYTVSKLLTHKDTKTTQRYAHLADQALRDAVNLSDRLQTVQQPSKVLNKAGGHCG
jgi:site-specific recombinase XerD